MQQPDPADLLAALEASFEREREARDRLIQARDELNDRDERFAALEAELWGHVEEHERSTREEIALQEREATRLREVTIRQREELVGMREETTRLRDEATRLRDEATRLRVRLDRIHSSAPMRFYASAKRLPGLRVIAARRTRKYEATVRVRLRV
jgi:chromosome segregation ATPase